LLKLIISFYEKAKEKLTEGATVEEIRSSPLYLEVIRARFNVKSKEDFDAIMKKVMEF
jgi:vacuolar-type H+-ATPase catalytic subunit A/Vma1